MSGLSFDGQKMPKRILIADDNATVRQVIKNRLFKTVNVEQCREAANGREAIELAAISKPDLVILDVSMPDMDGVTAAKRLKESMPETPIILFTLYKLDDSAAKLGVDAVVSKLSLGRLTDQVFALLFR